MSTALALRLLRGSVGGPATLQLSADGGWPGNMSPALHYNGKTYFGYAASDGMMYARSFVNATRSLSSQTAIGGPTTPQNWHNDPAFLVRDSDKRLLAVLCDHDAPTIFARISTNPEDISAWGAATNIDSQLGGGGYTYPVLVQLLSEPSDPIYLFYRDFQGGTTGVLCMSTTTNGGTTWAAQTEVFKNPGRYSYWQVRSNGLDRIDFAITDGSFEVDDASVYHFYYEGGDYFQSDGTLIVASLPLGPSDVTQIYSGSTAGARYVSDLAIDGTDIAVTFPVFVPSDTGYRYARWNGSNWTAHSVVSAGQTGDPWIEGGVVIDPANIDRLLLSRYVSGQWQMFDYLTPDAGSTWGDVQITRTADASFYPSFVRDGAPGLRAMWMYGTAVAYTDWDAAVIGLATP